MYLFVVGCKIKSHKEVQKRETEKQKIEHIFGGGVLLNSLNEISDIPRKLIGKFQNGRVAL